MDKISRHSAVLIPPRTVKKNSKEKKMKSLKVGEDEWMERERRGTKFMPQMRSKL